MFFTTFTSAIQNFFLYPAPGYSLPSRPANIEEVTLPDETVAWFHSVNSADSVLFFHGNGENLDSLVASGVFFQIAERLNVNILAVDYPGYGKSKGTPGEKANTASGIHAFEHLYHKTKSKSIFIVGWSLGAAVATQVASRVKEFEKLILISPWQNLDSLASTHFPSFIVSLFLRDRYASDTAASKVQRPTLLLHGQHDQIIPHIQGSRLAKYFKQGRFITIANHGHNDIFESAQTWHEMKTFLGRE